MSLIQAKPIATYDLYGPIHKGLRLALTDLLVRIGRTDPRDALLVANTIAAVREQCRISAKHLEHEDRHIHTVLEARSPGAAGDLDHAHAEHFETFAEIERLLALIETIGTPRAALWRDLYLRFARFVSDDFAHMGEEETVIQPLMQTLFTDEELQGIEGSILASVAPDDMMIFLGMMISGGSFGDRVALLLGVKANAPPPAFAAILDGVVAPRVTPDEFSRLIAALQAV